MLELAFPAPRTLRLPQADRVHAEDPYARQLLSLGLMRFLVDCGYTSDREIVVLCIGTDRSTGDALGPLTGSKLANRSGRPFAVYGTLENPVHAANLSDNLERIVRSHRNPFIVAIDACLGKTDHVGCISVKSGPLRPGTGVNKNLPPVGQMHVIGVVNVGGFMEYLVLQNTRLALVMKMADIIADSLYDSLSQVAAASSEEMKRGCSEHAGSGQPRPLNM
ncbi:MAG: spore protease YyaC [Betaproteobacteria bacterium]